MFDDHLLASPFNRPNRTGFLLDALIDLDGSLGDLGGRLVTRRGTWTEEVLSVAREVGVSEIHVADDVSGYARQRLRVLERAGSGAGMVVHVHPGPTVLPPVDPCHPVTRSRDAARPVTASRDAARPHGVNIGHQNGCSGRFRHENRRSVAQGRHSTGRTCRVPASPFNVTSRDPP